MCTLGAVIYPSLLRTPNAWMRARGVAVSNRDIAGSISANRSLEGRVSKVSSRPLLLLLFTVQ